MAGTLAVLPESVGPDSPRRAVRALQVRLARLGYVAGRFDARTGRAVLAFRKVTGMARLPVASQPVMRALALGRGAWAVRFRRHGRHVEADLGRQVLALIGRGGRVLAIYPTSPGTPTIRGSFRVYRKDRGTNAIGMVHSSYFRGGYAVHGYPSVPTYNASHGCLRVPVPDALRIFRWMRMGTRVDVYA
ncbi:MAG: L,D-transpeptidase family protein [Actinomycetota bacterium]|nr:L,D-transpeptidase family protein [Actinomycetota bacterium]